MTLNPSGRLSSCAMAVILLLALLAGCVDSQETEPPPGGHANGDALFPKLPKVTGHIDYVAANPENPRHFRLLRLTDDNGRQWEFQANGWAGVPVGHLKEHQMQGTAVTVWYEAPATGSLVARFVGD